MKKKRIVLILLFCLIFSPWGVRAKELEQNEIPIEDHEMREVPKEEINDEEELLEEQIIEQEQQEEKKLEEEQPKEEKEIIQEQSNEDNYEEQQIEEVTKAETPAPHSHIQLINNHLYYIDDNGKQVTGFITENGKIYFFSRTYGYALNGWVSNKTDGTWYQLDDGSLLTGIQEIDGEKYYFGENGRMVTGFVTIDGKLYFFSRTYGYALKGWVSNKTDGTWYQLDDGSLLTGIQEIDGEKYCFADDGKQITGFTTIDDKIYFFSRTYGHVLKGWVSNKTDGTWYQLDDGSLLTGIQEIEGKKYYFGENGKQITGFTTIDDKIYFFSRTYGYALNGWVSNAEGRWYQTDDGSLLTGLQEIEGKKYYLKDDGKMAFYDCNEKHPIYGWISTQDGKWYQSNDGAILTGVQFINNKIYYFADDGKQITGFTTIDDKIYFFSRTYGYALNGWVSNKTDGTWYQLDDGSLLTGKQVIDGKKYYFDEDGKIKTGFIEEDGKLYFYSRVYNYALEGWVVSETEGVWYQLDDASLITGPQTIEARDYIFNETTGRLEGFVIENGKKYYYNPDGTQAKGIEYMAGRFWQFNFTTGAFEKYTRKIRVIDISSHNGNIDWERVKSSGLVDAVILRLGYGIGYMDSMFIHNKNELERLGIPYSIYLFSYAENESEALRESNFVVDTIINNSVHIASNLFSIYYDLEDWEIKSTGENSYGISQASYRSMITTFINNVEKRLGIKARVYASKNYILERFPSDVQHYATWVAQWYHELTYQGPYEGWQYSSEGSVPGISGRVDMNYFYV